MGPLKMARAARLPNVRMSRLDTFTRDRIAVVTAVVTLAALTLAFILTKGTTFLTPGPLSSAHGTIENCSTCHAQSGGTKWSWLRNLAVAGQHAGSTGCLTCHQMPAAAFNTHGVAPGILARSTNRLSNVAAATPEPLSARIQSAAFPIHQPAGPVNGCAACHQEHQGGSVKQSRINGAQCRSCHVLKFDSFESGHPRFDAYPFRRRTRIVYDHAAHAGKHFPEVAAKDPAKPVPQTCSACHTTSAGKRVMALSPFDQTCGACHLPQITGKERASGPKGIAFLTLPGLDLQTLAKNKAVIGEWPEASEASLTPFMKMMLSRSEKGRVLLESIASLDLRDLSSASGLQIKAVAGLVYEIKALYFSLISGKASGVFGDLNIGGGTTLNTALVADLTASLPRDVLIAAQKQWLPNLAAEIADGPDAATRQPPRQVSPAPSLALPPAQAAPDSASVKNSADEVATTPEPGGVKTVKRDPPACAVRVLGQCLIYAAPDDASRPDPEPAEPAIGKPRPGDHPGASKAGLKDAVPPSRPAPPAVRTAAASGDAASAAKPSQAQSGDDLLFPTDEELREIKTRNKDFGQAPASSGSVVQPAGASAGSNSPGIAAPQPSSSQGMAIPSEIDPESWAEYGGWYQQDHAVFYRPVGHKDKFIVSWLKLTEPQVPPGASTPAAAVFEALTAKDAQGSCVKCHSVDRVESRGRYVNFSPLTAAAQDARFTRFTHEPHFGVTTKRGCLTCHEMQKGQPYLKSYEQGDPTIHAPQFGTVAKETCQTCHASGMARQDCLLCHTYHVGGVVTPITSTKLPTP